MSKRLARLTSFFEAKRRQCNLVDYRPLKTKANERRVKLIISMPLSNMPASGMPLEFLDPYLLMNKEKNRTEFTKIGVILEGALFTIFETDVARAVSVKAGSATLQDFKLVAHGVEEKRTIELDFNAYLPWSAALRNWKDDHLHSDFFIEVIPQQMELEEEEKPEPKAKGKKGKKTDFDAKAIQSAAKRGELVQ